MEIIEISDSELTVSPIRNYFKGKTIFLTGATGFIGQLLLEKLIRCDVGHIYMLARPKKNQAPMERFHKLFEEVQFTKARQHNPKFFERLSIIEGDMSMLGLGIKSADLEHLQDTVQIVLHVAADVRFNERIYDLVMTNLRGTRELLQLAMHFKKLQVFNYVSTAYSNCSHGDHIKEDFYEPPIDPATMIAYAERCSQQLEEFKCLEIVTQRLLGARPNTYTFSKTLSEALVRSYGDKFPLCVVRPSIIISTYAEPVPGWCNNFFGLNGILFNIGSGLIRIMYIHESVNINIVCADFTSNAILATTWATYEELNEVKTTIAADAVIVPKVYAIVGQSSTNTTFKHVTNLISPIFTKQPSKPIMWSHCLNSTGNYYVFWYLSIFYNFLSTLFLDLGLALTKKMSLMHYARKVHIFIHALTYFTHHQWLFEADNMNALCDRMHSVDKHLFRCDTRLFDFEGWIYVYFQGLRRYLRKDTDFSTEAEARVIYNRRKRIHPFVQIAFYLSQAGIIYLVAKGLGLIRFMESIRGSDAKC